MTRYFHGTTVELAPGDVLVPGNTLGRAVYGLGPRAAHVYATSGNADTEAEEYALSEAEEWASDAADVFCDGVPCGLVVSADDFQPHHDAWRAGDVLTCVRVYEVCPVDPDTVEPDDSTDVTHGGVRMAAARVVARVR